MAVFDTTNLPEAPLIVRENSGNNVPVCKSKYKGVRANENKWQARTQFAGQSINLGCFSEEKEAALAYAKARAYFSANPGAAKQWLDKKHKPKRSNKESSDDDEEFDNGRKRKATSTSTMQTRKPRKKPNCREVPEESDDDEGEPVPDEAPSAHTPTLGHDECLESKTPEAIANMLQGYGASFVPFCEQINMNSFNGQDIAAELDYGMSSFDDFLKHAGVDNFVARRKIYHVLSRLPRA